MFLIWINIFFLFLTARQKNSTCDGSRTARQQNSSREGSRTALWQNSTREGSRTARQQNSTLERVNALHANAKYLLRL